MISLTSIIKLSLPDLCKQELQLLHPRVLFKELVLMLPDPLDMDIVIPLQVFDRRFQLVNPSLQLLDLVEFVNNTPLLPKPTMAYLTQGGLHALCQSD